MASIVLRIDKRVSKNGMSPVRVRISHRHTAAWYATGVLLEPSCFQSESIYEPVSKKAYMAAEKRTLLKAIVGKWDDGMFELQRADGGEEQIAQMNATELRDYIFGTRDKKPKAVELVAKKNKTPHTGDFMAFLDKYGQSKDKVRTRENYAYVWRMLFDYIRSRRLDGLSFADINYERLVDMKAWLRGEHKGEPTRFKFESYVRAAFKEGLRMKMCSRDCDPFLDYRIEPVPEHDIETISRKQVKELMEVDCSGHPGLQRAKDVLLGSFFLCGINFQDMYLLPMGDEAVYIRQKVDKRTQRHVRVRVEPELSVIVAKYQGDGRMFNFDAGCRSLQYRLDDNFRALSAELGFKVNMAIIRRTWATLAAEIECPDAVIDMCMGHVARTVNSRFYVKPNWERAAKWNRKVIDYVLAA